MNGMASEVSARVGRLCLGLSFCSLLLRTVEKKELSAVTAASQLLLDETVPRWTETNAGPHLRSALKPECGCV